MLVDSLRQLGRSKGEPSKKNGADLPEPPRLVPHLQRQSGQDAKLILGWLHVP
jgi:hypothetical protein